MGGKGSGRPIKHKVAELEEENEKLKKRNSELAGQKASLERWLGEAKELIEDMYYQIPSSHHDYYKDVMERAEQFLKWGIKAEKKE